ncbi:hypothetical protein DLAC_10607 [Tieghemostelium lacteum]|uniref:Transmembrane protein n=1 Tax=Tieghemostelium lacteum TaxID=361077 RepID=A0A151Z4C0_TIELA|nr:hypothetical protein DLAC_10607 [Tieghemostelium lacteum]|eukprot:KYQ88809.1 hypothetical protein DLAC_10607 [Tieghemostelium lacteum]
MIYDISGSNIYLNKNGNDNGNGTIDNPYLTIDKVISVINSNISSDYNVYIGNGTFIATQELLVSNITLTIQPQDIQNDNVEIQRIQLKHGEYITIGLSNIDIDTGGWTCKFCNIFIENSTLLKTDIYLAILNSQLQINNSRLECDLALSESSSVITYSVANLCSLLILENSTVLIDHMVSDSLTVAYSISTKVTYLSIYNSIMTQFIIQYPSFDGGMEIVIENSFLHYSGPMFTSAINLVGCKFTMSNCTLQNLNNAAFIGSENSEVTLKNLIFVNFTCSNLIYTSNNSIVVGDDWAMSSMNIINLVSTHSSTVNISRIQYDLINFNIILVLGPSNIHLSQVNFTGGEIYQTSIILMPSFDLEYINVITNITMEDVTLTNPYGFNLKNAYVNSNRLSVTSYVSSNLFILNHKCQLFIENSMFSVNSFVSPHSLFFLTDSHLMISSTQFINCSSLFSAENSVITMDQSNITKSYSREGSFIYLENQSTLRIIMNYFYDNYFTTLFFVQNRSNLVIRNCTFDNGIYNSYFLYSNKQAVIDILNLATYNNIYLNDGSHITNSTLTMMGVNMDTEVSVKMAFIYAEDGSNVSVSVVDCQFSRLGFLVEVYDSQLLLSQVYISLSSIGLFYTSKSPVRVEYTSMSTADIPIFDAFETQLTFESFYITSSFVATNFATISCDLVFNDWKIDYTKYLDYVGTFMESNVTITNSHFTNISSLQNMFLNFKNCNVKLINVVFDDIKTIDGSVFAASYSTLYANNVVTKNLLGISYGWNIGPKTPFTLTNCQFYNNSVNLSVFSCIYDECSGNMTNSIFKDNIGSIGTCLSAGQFWNPVEFTNNTFINNTATIAGAVMYSMFKSTIDFSQCTLIDNHAIYGDIYATAPDHITCQTPEFITSGVPFNFYYQLKDSYDQTTISGFYITFHINITTRGVLIYSTEVASESQGSLTLELAGVIGQQFQILITASLNSIEALQTNITISPCLNYQYENPVDHRCTYCMVGQSYSQSLKRCLTCDSNVFCQLGNVVVRSGYQVLANDIAETYQCQPNLCLENNQCLSNYYSGPLCSQCLPNNSKTSIYCCTNYNSLVLIIYLLFLIILSSVLSFCKFSFYNGLLGRIVTTFQFLAIIFYSVPNFQFLPIFRISMEYIYGTCPFQHFSVYTKTWLSNLSILFLITVGSSDISLNILLRFYRYQSTKPRFIQRAIFLQRKPYYRLKSIWSNLMLFYPSLLFNIQSLTICKPIMGLYFLSLDPSYKCPVLSSQPLDQLSGYASIILGFLFILFIPIYMIYIFMIRSKVIRNTKIFYQMIQSSSYKSNFKLYDLVHITRSLVITTLSIALIYNQWLYIMLLEGFQIFYILILVYTQPRISRLNNYREYLSNFILLLLIIYYSTSYFISTSMSTQGNILTTISFLIIPILCLLNLIYQKYLNNQKKTI